jgi:hypothetical protein
MKRLWLVVLVFVLAGCAAMPTSGEKLILENPAIASPSVDKATVYFFREWKFGGGGISYYVFDGQEKIGAAWNGCYFTAPVSPGQHTFWGETEGKKYITLNVEAEKEYYVAMAIGMGFWLGLPEFTQVTPEMAKLLIKDMKYCKLVPEPLEPPKPPAYISGNQN